MRYHQLTRTHTVLTGGNVSKLLQSPCRDTKYRLRAFHCLNAFSLRQNCFAPDGFGFPSDFCFLSRRCVLTHQGEKNKKRRKDLPSGVCALVNWWYQRPCVLSGFVAALFILTERRRPTFAQISRVFLSLFPHTRALFCRFAKFVEKRLKIFWNFFDFLL